MGRSKGYKVRTRGLMLDTSREDVHRVYHDGTFSFTGTDVFRCPSGNVVKVNWTNWQGRSDKAAVLGKLGKDDENIREAILELPHIERVEETLEKLGLPGPEHI